MTKLFAVLVLLSAARAGAQEAWDARLDSASGDVTVYTADSPEGTTAEPGMPLEEGDRVVTGADGQAELSFDGDGLVSVEENSQFSVSAMSKGSSEVQLTLGSLVAKFKKLATGRRFNVRTGTAVAAVRGTEFGVEATGDETHVGVFDEGQVAVSDGQGREEMIGPNQESAVRRGQPPTRAQALQRFAQRRAKFAKMRQRHSALRAKWRAMPPERRRQMRQKFMQRMQERRRGLRDGRKEGNSLRNDRKRRPMLQPQQGQGDGAAVPPQGQGQSEDGQTQAAPNADGSVAAPQDVQDAGSDHARGSVLQRRRQQMQNRRNERRDRRRDRR